MLLKRGKIYYFRWQIPRDLREILGSRELVKSLKTEKLDIAQKKSLKPRLLVIAIQRIRALHDAFDDEDVMSEYNLLYKQFLKKLLNDGMAELDALEFSSYDDIEEYKAGLLISINKYGKALQTSELKVYRDGRSVLDELKEDILTSLPDDYSRCLFANLRNNLPQENYDKLLLDFIKTLHYILSDKLEKLGTYRPSLPTELIEPFDEQESPSLLLFSGLHAQFIEHKIEKRKLSPKIQGDYQRYLSDWLDLMGDNDVSEITTRDIKWFALSLSQLPKRNLKAYKGLAASVLIEMSFLDEDGLRPNYAREGVKWLQGVFVYAVDQEYLKHSPAVGIKLDLDRPKPFANYSNAEVRRMLKAASDDKKAHRKWIVWLAAYTGMRLGEIVQLTKSNISVDEDAQRYYLRVTNQGDGQSVKTAAGNRQVPLHNALLEEGFIEYVKGCADNSLFSEVNTKSISQWFPDFRGACGIPKYNDFGQSHVFHSFRHTVVTMSRGKGVPVVNVQQVIGHEKTGAGVTDRYTHNRPLKDVLDVIDCLDYS